MIVTIQKRYCYKQSYGTNLGSILAEQQKLQKKHPDQLITIEFNERSTTRCYRVVRLEQVEVEVPDPPKEEDYEVPKRPEPAKIAEKDLSFKVTKNKDDHGLSDWFNHHLVVTHVPSGTTVTRRIWSTIPDKLSKSYVRRDLEERLDPTFSDRLRDFNERNHRLMKAMNKWRNQCDERMREVKALA